MTCCPLEGRSSFSVERQELKSHLPSATCPTRVCRTRDRELLTGSYQRPSPFMLSILPSTRSRV